MGMRLRRTARIVALGACVSFFHGCVPQAEIRARQDAAGVQVQQIMAKLREDAHDYHREFRDYYDPAVASLEGLGEEAIPALRESLGAKDDNERVAAADALVRLGRQGAKALAASMGDPRWLARGTAALHLGKTGYAGAFDPLVRALERDPEAQVREAAAKSLGRLKNDMGIGPLKDALEKDPSDAVRAACAVSLHEFSKWWVDGALRKAYRQDPERNVRFWAAMSLGDHDDPTGIPELVRGLRTFAQTEAAAMLMHLKQPGMDALVGALNDEDMYARDIAVTALGTTRDPKYIPVLQGVARNDPEHKVRESAKFAIERIREGKRPE